jgi:hypothetical protein
MAAQPSVVPLAVPKHAPALGKIQDTAIPQQPPQSSKIPDPKKPLPTMTLAIIGIVILIVLALGAYVVVLPMLSGTGTLEKSGGITPGFVIPTASSPSGSV